MDRGMGKVFLGRQERDTLPGMDVSVLTFKGKEKESTLEKESSGSTTSGAGGGSGVRSPIDDDWVPLS